MDSDFSILYSRSIYQVAGDLGMLPRPLQEDRSAELTDLSLILAELDLSSDHTSPFSRVNMSPRGCELSPDSGNSSSSRATASPNTYQSNKTYICNICGRPGHFIKNCPLATPKCQSLTPYQGTKRSFGQFKCPRCKRAWMSNNSWANAPQSCKLCGKTVYPFRQSSLKNHEELDKSDGVKVHLDDRCTGQCRAVGSGFCSMFRRE